VTRPGRAAHAFEDLLSSLALKAEEFGERRFWRLGRWARDSIRAVHEGFVRALRAVGFRDLSPAEIDAAWAAPPVGLPPYAPHEAQHPAVPSPLARALRDGAMPHGDGGSTPVATLTFRDMPGGSPSMYEQFLFFALDGVEHLREAGERTGDPSWLEAAVALARRWCDVCLETERTPYVWDDHIAAVRALALARLWETCRTTPALRLDASSRARVGEAMARHARRLALESFYRADHNHGVTQALALFTLGVLLGPHPDAAAWTAAGADRLRGQIRAHVTTGGVHREHSPFYHFYVLRQVLDAARWAALVGRPLGEDFEARCRAMLAAGAHLLQPDGRLLPLGDTNRESYAMAPDPWPDAAPSLEADAYRHSASRGAHGSPPRGRRFRDDEGGILVTRSGWGEREDPTRERCLSLRLATLPTTHIHRDVLSFTWYGFGSDLVIDPGGPYGYGTPWRRDYFLRSLAHNTLTADDEDQPVGAATVDTFEEGERWTWIEASLPIGRGIVHRRLLLAHDDGVLLVVDRARAGEPHAWTQRFHLAPSLETKQHPTMLVATSANGGPGLLIHPIGDHAADLSVLRGVEPVPQGWVCTGDLRREPCAVVLRRSHGASVTMPTLLAAGPAGVPAAFSVSVDADRGDGARFRLTVAETAFEVDAPIDGPATVIVRAGGGAAHA
jgi:hypothetical protein